MLNHSEQQRILSELTSKKVHREPIKVNVTRCPYCQGMRYVKNGKYKGHQRYKCKTCSRNFSAVTGTSFQGIKKVDKFEEYKSILFTQGFTPLETIAKRVGISIQTAFDWRHKIFSSLKPEETNFKGVTEMDDVWFLYSQKGRKGLKYSRIRGGSKRKGDNDFQVKMLVVSLEAEGLSFLIVHVDK